MASTDRVHGGKGRFVRTLETAERDAAAAGLRSDGKTYQQIADQLGFNNRGDAYYAVRRALADVAREPVARLIASEAAQLDELYMAALDVLERDHVMVSHGRIVKDDAGEPLLDHGPKLNAIRELRAIRESYRKLHGIDAPSRVSVDAQQLGDEIAALLERATDGDTDG